MSTILTQVRDLLAEAHEQVSALLDGNDESVAEASVVPATDDNYPRGTVIWFRRASRSDDRIPAVIVRHTKGWTMCGRTGHFTWDGLKAEFFNEPLSWYSVADPSGMGTNQA